MASSSKKRIYLTLQNKVEVIKAAEKDRMLNHRTLAGKHYLIPGTVGFGSNPKF